MFSEKTKKTIHYSLFTQTCVFLVDVPFFPNSSQPSCKENLIEEVNNKHGVFFLLVFFCFVFCPLIQKRPSSVEAESDRILTAQILLAVRHQ